MCQRVQLLVDPTSPPQPAGGCGAVPGAEVQQVATHVECALQHTGLYLILKLFLLELALVHLVFHCCPLLFIFCLFVSYFTFDVLCQRFMLTHICFLYLPVSPLCFSSTAEAENVFQGQTLM